MIVVAAVALVVPLLMDEAERRRYEAFRSKAFDLRATSIDNGGKAITCRRMLERRRYVKEGENDKESRKRIVRWIDHYERLSDKYWEAAQHPWLPVPPDPPLPE